jgi:hypothetical protein
VPQRGQPVKQRMAQTRNGNHCYINTPDFLKLFYSLRVYGYVLKICRRFNLVS